MANNNPSLMVDGTEPIRRKYQPLRISGSFCVTADAAAILGASKQRVTVYLKDQWLTGRMVGNIWLIAADSVERLLEMKRNGSISAAFRIYLKTRQNGILGHLQARTRLLQ